MKKYLWFLAAFVIIVAAFGIFTVKQNDKVLGTSSTETTRQTTGYSNQVSLDYNGEKVTAYWYKVADPFNLFLIANFDDKLSAREVFENKNCKFVSDAGFYTKDSKPAGLFISEGTEKRSFLENKLFDGILSVNYLGTPRITRELPSDTLRIAVQTGPIIKENGEFLKLNITEDKEARRVVAAVTGFNDLYFLIFYQKSSAYIGPNLADMPSIVKDFEQKTGIVFADVVNLDGGSASAYYTNGVSLSELSPVGAFFCEK